MDIQFLGAAQTVTGSKTLVNTAAGPWLVDCGLFQGYKNLRKRNREPIKTNIQNLKGIALTHAHLDHSGLVPLLYQQGYRQPVYCSEATAELCQLLWPDSGYLMEEEAYFANKHQFSRHDPAKPLYTKTDAEEALKLLQPIEQNVAVEVEGLELNFQSAGHILGASSLYINDGHCRLGFSGDLGGTDDPVMYPPNARLTVDYLVVESTYGDRFQDRSDISQKLAQVINDCSARGGSLLIPSFAVGRAQLLMHLITSLKSASQIPDLPIFLDSPMAINASELYGHFHNLHRLDDAACQTMFKDVRFVRTADESKALVASNYPKIVISASGMATGGRVLHHLKKLLPDHRNGVLLVGYQAGGTRGDRLAKKENSIKIHGQYCPVKAEVSTLHGLSAHADQRELLAWLDSNDQDPQCLFVNHGDPAAADALRLKVEESLIWTVEVPNDGQRFELSPSGTQP